MDSIQDYREQLGQGQSVRRPDSKECRNSRINPASAIGKAMAQDEKGGKS